MLYCVFSGEYIIGRFKSKERATRYWVNCCLNNYYANVTMKIMTIEEYKTYMERQIRELKE